MTGDHLHPINKAINDFRKRLNAGVSADGGHFEHRLLCELGSRA